MKNTYEVTIEQAETISKIYEQLGNKDHKVIIKNAGMILENAYELLVNNLKDTNLVCSYDNFEVQITPHDIRETINNLMSLINMVGINVREDKPEEDQKTCTIPVKELERLLQAEQDYKTLTKLMENTVPNLVMISNRWFEVIEDGLLDNANDHLIYQKRERSAVNTSDAVIKPGSNN